MEQLATCNLCEEPDTLSTISETAEVRSNVRAFRHESFTVWRCHRCRSIHARDEVDLDHYYRGYPFQRQKSDFFWRRVHRNYARRLERAGVKSTDSVLDYGCGSGLLLEFLRQRGYRDVNGYDAYSPSFNKPSVLGREYDCVILQDVIEHVAEPRALIGEAMRLTKAGGRICVGTPNAEALDLRYPEKFLHQLHQPYHRHILSEQSLRRIASNAGLEMVDWYDTYHCDLFVPFGNLRYAQHYAALFDNTLDLAFEPIRYAARMFTPKAIVLGLLGRFFPVHTEMMAIMRKPGV